MSGAPSSSSRKSKQQIKITSKNVFLNDLKIRTARRAKLKSLNEFEEIDRFSKKQQQKADDRNKITLHTWIEKFKPFGVVGVYDTATYEPKNNVETATIAVANFVNGKKRKNHVRNIFESGPEVGYYTDEVVKGYYIDDNKKVKIDRGEWYKVKWASLYVEFKNIKNIPDDEIREQMYDYVRLNYPDIYRQITNSNEPASNSMQQNISDRPSTSKVSQITDQNTNSSETSPPSSDVESSTTERVSKSKNQTLKHKTKKDKLSKTKDKHLKSKHEKSKSKKHETSKSKKHKKSKSIEKDLKHKHKSSKYTAKSNTKSSEKSLVSNKESHQSHSTKQLQINPSQMDSGAAQVDALVGDVIANNPTGSNQSNLDVNSIGKPSTNNIQPQMIEALKEELSKYYALAFTAFEYEDEVLKTQNKPFSFNVIFVHFVNKDASNRYKLQTRLLYFEPTNDNCAIWSFGEAIIPFGLGATKYLSAVTEANLEKSISNLIGCKWIPCIWEFMDTHFKTDISNCTIVLKENQIDPSTLSKYDDNFANESVPKMNNMIDSLAKTVYFANFYAKNLPSLKDDFSASNLLAILLLLRNNLEKKFSSVEWSENLVKILTEKIHSFMPTQLVAFFLSPSDLKMWLNPGLSGDFKFTDDRKQMIIRELEEFEINIPENERRIVTEVDESSLEPAMKRQKRLKDEMILLYGNDENEDEATIAQEVEHYITAVKGRPDLHKLAEFELLNDPRFPRLKRAALFFLSVPATIRPCVSLLRVSLAKVRPQNGGQLNVEKLFNIINNPSLIADENGSNLNMAVDENSNDTQLGDNGADDEIFMLN